MSTLERIKTAMKEAMKSGDKVKLSVVRTILAEFKRYEIDNKLRERGILDEECNVVLSKMLKQRNDSALIYKEQNRPDLEEVELKEIAILKQFLPEQLSDAELHSMITAEIAALGASSVKDMGKVMSSLKPKIIGKADPKVVSAEIKKQLAG